MRYFIFFSLALASDAYTSPTSQAEVDYDVLISPFHEIMTTLGSINRAVDKKIKQTYSNAHFRGFSGTFTEHEVETLRSTPGVLGIDPVSEIHVDATRTNAPWGLQRISQPDAVVSGSDPSATAYTYNFEALPGGGVDIYMIDSGIRVSHAQFEGRATMGFSAFSSNTDDNGHGTHTSGIAGGSTVGVASNANLIGVKVVDSTGSGGSTALIAGIDYVISQHTSKNSSDFIASVASISIGYINRVTTVETALKSMSSAGVHISVSAGNVAADTCDMSLGALGGNNSDVIAVGAMDILDEIASFSNTGPCNDLYAPGVDVYSAWINGDDAYAVYNGTSMAAPHVSGLIAYYAALNPGISTADMKDLIVSSAVSGKLTAGDSDLVPGGALIIAQNGEDA